MVHRRRGLTAGAVVLALALLGAVAGGGAYLYFRPTGQAARFAAPSQAAPSGAPATPSAAAIPTATPAPTPTPTPITTFPRTGPGTYRFATGQSGIFGTAGRLEHYRVAVESNSPVSATDFATMVDATLSDPRSWIAGRNVRLQRVPQSSGSDFTVYLVTAGTAGQLCGAAGFDIEWHGEPYSSCSLGPRVLINMTRYLTAIPDYGAPLVNYQQYAINHEVGHALGHGHELCPGPGKPAPVMQQQTFGLHGLRGQQLAVRQRQAVRRPARD